MLKVENQGSITLVSSLSPIYRFQNRDLATQLGNDLHLLDENPVHQYQSQWNNEQNVGKIEDEFGDKLFRTISLDVPMSNPYLERRL